MKGMTADDSEILIDLQDFQRIEVMVVLENTTSHTSVGQSSRRYGEIDVSETPDELVVRLMEFTEKGIALDVPEKSGAVGHQVEIHFDVTGTALPFVFSGKGMIKEIDKLEDQRERFVIDWVDVDERYVEAIKGLFSKRQDEIENFLNAVRGR